MFDNSKPLLRESETINGAKKKLSPIAKIVRSTILNVLQPFLVVVSFAIAFLFHLLIFSWLILERGSWVGLSVALALIATESVAIHWALYRRNAVFTEMMRITYSEQKDLRSTLNDRKKK